MKSREIIDSWLSLLNKGYYFDKDMIITHEFVTFILKKLDSLKTECKIFITIYNNVLLIWSKSDNTEFLEIELSTDFTISAYIKTRNSEKYLQLDRDVDINNIVNEFIEKGV